MSDIITSSLAEDFSNLLGDNIEIALDLISDDGILKELPVIGDVISIFKIGKTIADRLFIKNLIHFMYQLKDISIDKKIEMVKRIEENEKYKIKIGDYITSILIRTETTNKSNFIGFIFGKYIKEEIDLNEFLQLSFSISNILWNDVIEYATLEEISRINNSILVDKLISNGLMTIHEIGTCFGNSGGPINAYSNDLGKLLKEIYVEYSK